MTRTVVVMVTVSERVGLLNDFLVSMRDFSGVTDIAIHMQGGAERDDVRVPEGVNLVHFRHTLERLGCHAARVVLLRDLTGRGYESYVNVDDDVLLNRYTDWGPAIDKANYPGVGFVLTNWVRHINAMPRAIDRLKHKFVSQVMVYNGGGMAYSNVVADLIRELEPVPARYDDIWPLTAYLNGHRNYRYLGSLAVHRIMSKGGMNDYMRSEPRPLLCWDWINYRLLNGQRVGSDYVIPSDADLRPEAKELHRKVRTEKGWS